MLRSVLTAYLAFVTAAAPCLCCCTTARLFAAPPAKSAPPATAPSCCHEVETPADPVPAPQPKAPEPRCPCRDHSDMQGQVTVGPVAAELALALTTLVVALIANPDLDPTPVVDVDGPVSCHDPFLSATDLLHVHHRLRC